MWFMLKYYEEEKNYTYLWIIFHFNSLVSNNINGFNNIFSLKK